MLIEMKLQMNQVSDFFFLQYCKILNKFSNIYIFSNSFIAMQSTAACFPLFRGLCFARESEPTNLFAIMCVSTALSPPCALISV